MGRGSFSREFKLEVVRLVRERGVSVAQAARDLDLHPNMLATGCGSWQPNRSLAPGEMHGPALALAISARFAALHESRHGTNVWTGCVSQERLCVESGSR